MSGAMFNALLPRWFTASFFAVSLIVGAALIAAACGSSAETITFTSPARCGTQAQADGVTFGADGGAGVIRVTTSRECQWSAKSDASWISLPEPASGQGEGSIRFTIISNPDPLSRAAAIAVEDQRLQLSQEGRRCEFKLSSLDENVDGTGGQRTVQVSTPSMQCRWTAATDVEWIALVSGVEGSGSGAVTFRIDALRGSSRTGTIRIAGQIVHVEQAEPAGQPGPPGPAGPPGPVVPVPPGDKGSTCSYNARHDRVQHRLRRRFA